MKKINGNKAVKTNDLLSFCRAKIIPNQIKTIVFGLNDVHGVLFVKMTIDIEHALTICHDKKGYIYGLILLDKNHS